MARVPPFQWMMPPESPEKYLKIRSLLNHKNHFDLNEAFLLDRNVI
jgi:hypothetical protein